MKIKIILFLIAISFCSQAQMKKISPGGKTVQKIIDIQPGVTKLSIGYFNSVNIIYGNTPKAVIELDSQLEDRIEVTNSADEFSLNLNTKKIWLMGGVPLKLTLTIPALKILFLQSVNHFSMKDVKLLEDAVVTVKSANDIDLGKISADSLLMDIDASNNVRLQGVVGYLQMKLNASNVDLPNLEINHLDVSSRASLLKADVIKNIRITGNKASTLFYKKRADVKVIILDQRGTVVTY